MAFFNVNFTSYTLSRDVEIDVLIPSMTILDVFDDNAKNVESTHVVKEKYPVMYLLHGFANNRNSWFNYTSVARYAEERRIAVVTVSAENKSYSKVGGDDFKKFISKELQEFVTSMFPVSTRKEDTYIAGLSMGGYGTLLHSLTNPERFQAIGAFSAGIEVNPERLAQRAVGNEASITELLDEYDLFKLADKVAAEKKEFPKVFMACGHQDRLYDVNVKFRDYLINLGADVTWDEIEQYGHEWPFWDIEVKNFLDWIPRTDYYATLPHTGV